MRPTNNHTKGAGVVVVVVVVAATAAAAAAIPAATRSSKRWWWAMLVGALLAVSYSYDDRVMLQPYSVRFSEPFFHTLCHTFIK